jgi:dTDP-glucose 4,6-dehydratase
MAKKRAVVLGGAGFLGSHLCEALLARGEQVVCVDNYLTGSRRNVEHLLAGPDFELLEADITEPFSITGPVDHVLNFASPASPIDYAQLPIETLRVGSIGTEHGLQLAREKKARFLQASTSEIYGDPLIHPQVETYFGNVNPLGPRSCYDEAKRYGEAICAAYARVHGVEVRIVRIFNTYGPRMRLDDGRVVPAFISQLLRGEDFTVFGRGEQTRSFCYASDEVRGILLLLDSAETGPVNIGNPVEMTVLEFVEAVRAAGKSLGLPGADGKLDFKPFPENDPKRRRPDITKARTILGWEPKVPLAEGLRTTIGWFKDRGFAKPLPPSGRA